jgi:hypothetical protein
MSNFRRRDGEVVSLGACLMAGVIAQLIWIDRKGNEHTRTGDAAVLAKQLKTLRCEAKLTLLNGEVIGECTRLLGVKLERWVWAYNLAVLKKQSKDSPPRRRHNLGDTPCSSCRNFHHNECRGHLNDGTACSCSCPIASNYRNKIIRD